MPEAAAPNGAPNGAPESPQSLLAQFHARAEELGGLEDDPNVVIQPDKDVPAPKPAPVAAPADPAAPKLSETQEPAPTKPGGSPDWAAFRQQQRTAKERADAREAAFAQERTAFEARVKAAEATSPERIKAHFESGNFDEVAKALGWKSWNDMNDHATRAFASPEYKQNQAVKTELERLKEERAEEKRQRDAEIAEARRQHAEREYIGYLDTSLKSSADAAVKTLATDPGFTRAVFSHMSAHYNATGEELEPEEAAREMLPGIRAHYEHLHKIFGAQPTVQQAETVQAVTPDRAGSKQPARQTNKVARTRAAESGEMTHAEFIKMGAREMEKSLDQDMREGKF